MTDNKILFVVHWRCRSENYIWLFRVDVLQIVVLQRTATKMHDAHAVLFILTSKQ